MGSATAQGQLWGAPANDWAAYGEQIGLPLQGAAVDAAHVTAGTRLLDAGCDARLLALLAHLRGARVTALDAAPALLAVVRERVSAADVREGDLEALPFADVSFDAVAVVNSFSMRRTCQPRCTSSHGSCGLPAGSLSPRGAARAVRGADRFLKVALRRSSRAGGDPLNAYYVCRP